MGGGMKVCIIKSGDVYFRKFVLNTPEMDSDIRGARRLSKSRAKIIKRHLKKTGYKSEIIELRHYNERT